MKNILLAAVVLFSLPTFSQTKPVAKFKPPKLHTSLGLYTDSASVSPETAAQLVTLPLKIRDAKNKEYKVSSYQLAYKKIGVTEDESTGKTSPTQTVSAALFKTTPLNSIWISTIQEQVKPGDELYFFAVIARDDKGRVMYSGDLKLLVR